MKKLLKVTIISIICTMLQACNSGLVVEKSTVSATVTNTEYKASYTLYYPRWDFNQKRATIARQFVPSEYLVILSYKDIVQVFDNKKLYTSSQVGDGIEVKLYQYYDKDGTLKEEKLKLK